MKIERDRLFTISYGTLHDALSSCAPTSQKAQETIDTILHASVLHPSSKELLEEYNRMLAEGSGVDLFHYMRVVMEASKEQEV